MVKTMLNRVFGLLILLPVYVCAGGFPEGQSAGRDYDVFEQAAEDDGPILLRPGNGPDLGGESAQLQKNPSKYHNELKALEASKRAIAERERAVKDREAELAREMAQASAILEERKSVTQAQIDNAEGIAHARRAMTLQDADALLNEIVSVKYLRGATLQKIVQTVMPPDVEVSVAYDPHHQFLHTMPIEFDAQGSRRDCLREIKKQLKAIGVRVEYFPGFGRIDESGDPAPTFLIAARKKSRRK